MGGGWLGRWRRPPPAPTDKRTIIAGAAWWVHLERKCSITMLRRLHVLSQRRAASLHSIVMQGAHHNVISISMTGTASLISLLHKAPGHCGGHSDPTWLSLLAHHGPLALQRAQVTQVTRSNGGHRYRAGAAPPRRRHCRHPYRRTTSSACQSTLWPLLDLGAAPPPAT